MRTALEKDVRSGRGRNKGEIDYHELNVAHVSAGLAFELALKALAKSEGRSTTTKHETTKNYRSLGSGTQMTIKKYVEERIAIPVERFLDYLDEYMCHPDRKYWMVGKKGELRGVGFVHGRDQLIIPTLAIVHREIVDMAGENTYENWQRGTRVMVTGGDELATAYVGPDGSIRWSITKVGKEIGLTTSPAPRTLHIVCPHCGCSKWQKEKQAPEPDDRVTCKNCRTEMRAADVEFWNRQHLRREG